MATFLCYKYACHSKHDTRESYKLPSWVETRSQKPPGPVRTWWPTKTVNIPTVQFVIDSYTILVYIATQCLSLPKVKERHSHHWDKEPALCLLWKDCHRASLIFTVLCPSIRRRCNLRGQACLHQRSFKACQVHQACKATSWVDTSFLIQATL